MLSGGGVKGIGLVGAVVALMDAGYSAQRVSGTSAGSIVGAVVAAAAMGDQLGPEEVKELALQLDYHKFTDPGTLERVPVLGPSLAVLRGTGIYKGDYAHDWVRSQLKNLGVRTFGDLAIRRRQPARRAALQAGRHGRRCDDGAVGAAAMGLPQGLRPRPR